VLDSISNAERYADVRLSPAAREIVALFMISPAFEGPDVTYEFVNLNSEGAQVTDNLREQLPSLLQELRDTYGIVQRRNYQGVVTVADLYHFLTEKALTLVTLSWPYPKD
jgi:hypothetical protein